MNSIQEVLGNMFRDRKLAEDEYVNEQDGLAYAPTGRDPFKRRQHHVLPARSVRL